MKRETQQARVIVFDTTLRDGEQSPGATMTTPDKVLLAQQLARLGVDVIEAGFPASSDDDFAAVARIAKEVKGPIICGLARMLPNDIEKCAKALEPAARKRIHVFIGTSPVHMKDKLNMSKEEILSSIRAGVSLARSLCEDVQFSCEDASRSDVRWLAKVIFAAIDCGATTINLPDTVGAINSRDYSTLITRVIKLTARPGIVFSVHCHNDLGLATANSLAGLGAGARQVECTINGIGERGGNAALEEVVVNLSFHKLGLSHKIDLVQLGRTSRLVTRVTGIKPQPNKAIVGANAFSHEAGIHQAGMLKNRITYEILDPASVGWEGTPLPLGKHSGRNALRGKLEELGFVGLIDVQVDTINSELKKLAARKRYVDEGDLAAIAARVIGQAESVVSLVKLHLNLNSTSSDHSHTAVVTLRLGTEIKKFTGSGNGYLHAACLAIGKGLLSVPPEIKNWSSESVSAGADAQAEATIIVDWQKKPLIGHAVDTDILVAGVKAYLSCINLILVLKHNGQ